jgi:sulfur carrier protein
LENILMSEQIEITLNGQNSFLNANSTVAEFITQHDLSGRFLLVVNDEIVPRSTYADTRLNHGDRIDVMSPISGG